MFPDSFIHRLFHGEFLADDAPDHKADVSATFFANVEKAGIELEQLIQQCRDDISSVETFGKHFEWLPTRKQDLIDYMKNSTLATTLREKANAFYSQGNMEMALRGYNLAIAFCFTESSKEELALAYANRSAVLLELDCPTEALRDIALAISNEYPEKSKAKLEERRMKCDKMVENKRIACMESKQILEEQQRRMKYRQHFLFKVKQPNPNIPTAENFVAIRVDSIQGRHLVVTRDIPAGTVLVVEEPFVKVLKNELKWELNHCHYCFKAFKGGIPCNGCVFAVYCSEKCLQEAQEKYHKYECPCLPYLHFTRTPRYVQLAFRIICILGPQELYNLFTTKDPRFFNHNPTNDKDAIAGIDPETLIYSSSSYLPIYHLISHPPLPTEVAAFTNIVHALIFSCVLEEFSNFYNVVEYSKDLPKDKFKTFVASIILHHIQNIPSNSISVDEMKGLEEVTLWNQHLIIPTVLAQQIRGLQFPQYGSASYAVSSLINHACDPNVTRVHDLSFGRMAIVALKGLKTGEELFTSYSRIFIADEVQERRQYLDATYRFLCNCIACSQMWPLLPIFNKVEPRFCCSNCSKQLKTSEKGMPSFKNCILDSKGRCARCKKCHSLSKLKEELSSKYDNFFKSYDMMLRNCPMEAIRLVAPCIQFFQYNICPPYGKSCMAQDVLKLALDLVVYFSE